MTTGKKRRTAAFGALVGAALLVAAGTPQVAAADGTRTINASVSCASGIVPFGFQLNLGAGWAGADGTSYQVPGTQTKVLTAVIPSSATSVALDTFCYYSSAEYNGTASYPYGTWNGFTYSLTPGTSTVNSTWTCARQPVYPGPWIRTCSLTAISS